MIASSLENVDGSLQSAAAARARLPRRVGVLAALETVALATLFIELCLPAQMRAHAGNAAPLWFRILSVALPLSAGVIALVYSVLWVGACPERAAALRNGVQRGAPLLALWPAPVLLDRHGFAGQPLFLLLATGGAALGLERCCRFAAPGYRSWLALPRWRAFAASRTLPRLIAVLAIGAAATFLVVGSVLLHARMMTSIYDLGLFENLFWNTLHGRPGIALGEHYFAEHAELLLYPLLSVYALAPRPETLLVLQGVFMAGAAVPLYLLAERWLRSSWAALPFVLAYLSHPALHGPAFYDFHFLPLSAFFLLWAAYFHARRVGSLAFWSAILLALCCREDVAIGVAVVGAGLAWNERRIGTRTFRTGLALFALGLAWFLSVKFAWMPQFGKERFAGYYSELISPPSRGFGGVLLTVFSNPLYTLSRLFTEQKLLLALQLLVPLAFLPIRRARAWFLLLPGLIVVGLANSESTVVSVEYHYATHFLPYVFVAALFALAVRARSARAPALLAVAFASLVSAVHFSAFQRKGDTDPFPHVSFHWSADDAARLETFRSLAARIPNDASVSAGENEGAQLAHRRVLRDLKLGIDSADYVLYSPRSLQWGGREELERVLHDGSYGVVDTAGDFTLLARDYDPAHNAQALRRLR